MAANQRLQHHAARQPGSRNVGKWVLGTLTTLAFAGCANGPALKTDVSASAIRAAEEVGANQVPQASLHLQLAKEELDRANKLAGAGEKEQAASFLMRAEADAELAVVLARADTEKRDANDAMNRVHKLQQGDQSPAPANQ